jgi:hypothetical protein
MHQLVADDAEAFDRCRAEDQDDHDQAAADRGHAGQRAGQQQDTDG